MIKYILLISIIFFQYSRVAGQSGKDHRNLNKSNVALEGYDAVAYFTQRKAVEGEKTIRYEYKGAYYNFSSNQNLTLFKLTLYKQNAEKYLPAYGGWCAYAMGDSGEKVKVDPETFKIINGKLYLFYNFLFNNTLDSWNENENVLKQKADQNWNKIKQTK